MSTRPATGRLGVWATELRFAEPGFIAQVAPEMEALGYGALWFPGGRGGDVTGAIDALLDLTDRVTIATGILNIWMHEPAELGAWWRGLAPEKQARVMLGLGVGHASAVGEAWKKPLETMAAYLDALDAEGIPAANRCIAALGPKMIDLARERSAGTHPYLVTPEHTAMSRQRLGAGPLLAPEQGVVCDTDPESARATARAHLAHYATLPNYRASWRRQGFSDREIARLSDDLIDDLFVYGSHDRIAERVRAHLDAGADHVCLQVISGAVGDAKRLGPVRAAWRNLGPRRFGLAD
jgi:probable F420-dependent oxidoreductase